MQRPPFEVGSPDPMQPAEGSSSPSVHSLSSLSSQPIRAILPRLPSSFVCHLPGGQWEAFSRDRLYGVLQIFH